MKKFLLLCLILLVCTVHAKAVDIPSEQTHQFGLDGLTGELSEDTLDALDGSTPTDPGSLSGGVGKILSNAAPDAAKSIRAALRVAVCVIAVVILCAMVTQMESNVSQNAVRIAGTLGIVLLSAAGMQSMVGLGQQTLDELQSFSELLLPVLAAATAASGSAVTASAVYVASVFITDLLITVINRLLMPLVYAFLAVSAADTVLGNQTLTQLSALLKWIITWTLKAAIFLFTAYLAVTRIISGTTDETAVKAAKLAVSTAVPVVGSMISDASETVLLSAKVLKNSAGLFGMLAVLAICTVPLIRIGIRYLVMKVTAAICGPLGDKQLTQVVGSVSEAMGLLAAMTGTCGFMLLISCVCSIRAVSV